MLIVALGVKLGSPGPVIFKQRRYGLDGREIVVYKFRSMTVTEDGGNIQQAQKNDKRVTPLGAILRKTSLDELPQFINVLQGKMSIVGPRPHAVAHNEQYRKLIDGYMVRHKVKPGITGWAQVNGYRGETELLEKMKKRIDFDLDYLRHWSLRLDLYIILKTVQVLIKDKHAY
jgi:putative colanic acid biosynthesis UDP-glucose lipid carrier transferase